MFYYSTGFFIESNYEALKYMSDYVIHNNKLFGFNFASDYLYVIRKCEIIEMMKRSDFVFCNKDEAIACAKHLY